MNWSTKKDLAALWPGRPVAQLRLHIPADHGYRTLEIETYLSDYEIEPLTNLVTTTLQGKDREKAKTPRTQMERAADLRERIQASFPALSEALETLERLVEESADVPDKTIVDVQHKQLRALHTAGRDFLLAQLFDTRA